jgi:hypothetical protein
MRGVKMVGVTIVRERAAFASVPPPGFADSERS